METQIAQKVGALKTNRGFIKYLLLSTITFGIYHIVIMSSISTDINTIASRHDGKKTMHYCLLYFLVSWITLFIGNLVWYHNLSKRIEDELKRRNITYSFGVMSYWGWNLLGLLIAIGPLVYKYKLFKAMNLLSENYNTNGC
ncbi:MAG TPA: DUF4234 domain-containing protein [Candidatus Faecousia intestinigallinarum]|nr:DUF4234 domain-containing protein [Candidatus Faecousia intestinigallinarum]